MAVIGVTGHRVVNPDRVVADVDAALDHLVIVLVQGNESTDRVDSTAGPSGAVNFEGL
jgi:hypothetical protein